MSAIGSYAVLQRGEWNGCAALAQNVRTETTGRWMFKQSHVTGIEEFQRAWQAALVQEVAFDYSGYALGTYLDAQQEINGLALVDEQSESARVLARVFTAGFFFDTPVLLPVLPPERLTAFCTEEYGEEAAPAVEAVTAADGFFRRGLAEISSDRVVIFVIR